MKEMRKKRTKKEKEAHKNVESSKSREEDVSRRKKLSLLTSVRSKVPKIIFFFKVGPLKVATWKSRVTLIRMVSVEVRD